MKLPGRAWLEFSVTSGETSGSRIHQRAVFIPRDLAGQLYWWAVTPFHRLVFGGMVRNIVGTAEALASTASSTERVP